MNEDGGMACKLTKQTRRATFGESFVTEKRISYCVMMMKGAAASAAITAGLLYFRPPQNVTSELNKPGAEFFVRASIFLLVQTILFTLGGMRNNPTLK